MRFIHLSDFHYSDDKDHEHVINALLKDLSQVSRESNIDAVLCTGDLANKGNTDDKTITKICHMIDRIREAIEGNIPFFVCPGNHDIDLKSREEIFKPIFDSIKTAEEASKTVNRLAPKDLTGVLSHINGFIKLSKHIDNSNYNKHPLVQTHIINIDGNKVGIAVLNSCWTTKGGGTQDYGNLFLGESQIDIATEEIRGCDFKIAIMHHTLDWLSPNERANIQRNISINFDALLCGHNHDTNANIFIGNIGTIFTSNTGCIYHSKQYFNGYSILEYDNIHNKWTAYAREYFYQRNEFDISPRFANDGKKEFPLLNTKRTDNIVIASGILAITQEKANSKLLSYSASEIAPKQLGAIFVEPPLARVSEKKFVAQESIKSDTSSSDTLSIRNLSELQKDILIIGKRESGKTTLLNHIVIDRFFEFHKHAKIGMVVDLSALSKLTTASILERSVEFTGSELRRSEIVNILKSGSAVIGFDNAQIHNQKHINLISSFCTEYPLVRYIIAASEELVDEFSIDTAPTFGRENTVAYIHSLKSKQTRELVSKWFMDATPSSLHSQKRLMLVNNLLTRLHVPRTPFLVSVLLWVIEQKPNATLINQATAIEALIEGLLEKFKESKLRSDFDSTIQSHFLSEFASKLDQDETEWVSSLDFEDYVVNYFKRKGLKVSIRGFTDELLRKGLLYEGSDRITFKFDCFRAFFLARKFAEQPTTLQKIYNPTGIDKYFVELDILTGLHRDRIDILENVRSLCKSLVAPASMDIEFSLLDQLVQSNNIFGDDDTLKQIEQGLLHEVLDERRREEIADLVDTPSDVSVDHDIGRKRKSFGGSSSYLQFVAALRALSAVLRNSELIDDVEMKRDSLNDALVLWAKLLIGTLYTANNLSYEEFSTIPNINHSEEDFNNTKLMLRLFIPIGIVGMMCESLSTPKLETFIMEKTKDKENIIRSLSVFLALDTLTEDSIKEAKYLMRDLSKNSVITQSLFFKLLQLYLFEAPSHSINSLRDCLADSFTILRGGNLKNNSIIKGQFLNQLDKQVTTGKFTDN